MGLNPPKDKVLNLLLNMALLVCTSKGWAGLGSVQLLLVPHFVPARLCARCWGNKDLLNRYLLNACYVPGIVLEVSI